jgi:Lar family restriction alleviation protein
MKDNLKPCPFCGENKLGIYEKDGKYRVICINPSCHIPNTTYYQNTKQQAKEYWNRRVNNEI